jgi:hypothetical protein
LVHGEQNEMLRLKSALVREYEENSEDIKVYNPRNTVGVDFYFTGEKTAKVYTYINIFIFLKIYINNSINPFNV